MAHIHAASSNIPGNLVLLQRPIPGQLVVAAALFWGITLLGLVLWTTTHRLTEAGRAVQGPLPTGV